MATLLMLDTSGVWGGNFLKAPSWSQMWASWEPKQIKKCPAESTPKVPSWKQKYAEVLIQDPKVLSW